MKKLIYLLICTFTSGCISAQTCYDLKREYDKFEKSISYSLTVNMPATKAPSIHSIHLLKDSSEVGVQYLLTVDVEVTSADYVKGRKGMIMLFKNGEEYRNSYASAFLLPLPSKRLSATSPMDKKDLLILLNGLLTDLRLGSVDIVISPSVSKLLNEGVNCLLNAR